MNEELDEHVPKRPGKIFFLLSVAIVGCVVLLCGWSVWNLGDNRPMLLKKPIYALKVGLGLERLPEKPQPRAKPILVQRVSGELIVENIQIDWNEDNAMALVSGHVHNQSNVTHGEIELSIQLFDEMTKSLVIKRSQCCQVIGEESARATDGSPLKTTQDIPAVPSQLIKTINPGSRQKFATQVRIRKPKKGEVTAKVKVHYSEVLD